VKNNETVEGSTVLCISSGRREKDRAIRKKQEKRLLADLAKLKKRIAKGRLVKKEKIGEAIGRLKERYPRVARYYRIEYDAKTKTFVYEMNEEKMCKAEKLDGSYLLKTDRKDLSDEEVWRIYNLLTRAEDAFRAMKSPLMERPIFHQLVRRVETHIFLCILAYHLLVSIEKTLLDKGVHTSWGTVRETLSNHEVCTIVLPTNDGMVLKIRKASTPEPAHKQLYKLLDVPGPIIRPKKRWVV
jgi:transposase